MGGRNEGSSNPMYGRHHTEETKDKMHKSLKGRKAWNKKEKIKRQCIVCGAIKLYTPSQIKNGRGTFCSRKCQGKYWSEHNKGENNPRWTEKIKRNCLICEKVLETTLYKIKIGGGKYCSRNCARKASKHFSKPTKPELIFEQICKNNNLDFHYVGDGQLWIGKDKILNPDFIEANGKKICVEIMGAYWHSPLLNRNLRENALLPYREKHYKKYKWQPIFIWDTDLIRKDAEEFVLNILRGGV